MMLSLLRKNLVLWLCLGLASACSATAVGWHTVAPGMEYVEVKNFPQFPNGSLHAFRFDLKKYDLTLAPILQKDGSRIPLADLVDQSDTVLAVNGGFFSDNMKPLGLRVSDGQTLNPLRPISWWGVFYIQDGKAKIVAKKDYKPGPDIHFAIQAGPRLLVHREIPKMGGAIDYRTALCVTGDNQVIIVVTQNLLLSTTQLAEILQSHNKALDFDCTDAINLDGGHSTQLFAHTKDFELEVPSIAPIAEALLVTPKKP